MAKRVGIWVRVSTDKPSQKDSPTYHLERGKTYAQSKEWEVVEVYSLEAVSGKSAINHLETKRMLFDIERGHIDGLIFSSLPRLARNLRELIDFVDFFREKGASMFSLQESIDASTHIGRFFYALLSALAQFEREEISNRISASVAVRVKMGKLLGGQPPYGYRFENGEMVINEEEAPIRRLMFDLFLEHKRKATVTKIINERGYRTRKGKPFSDVAIARNLKDTVAKGIRWMNYSLPITRKSPEGLKPEDQWVCHPCPAIVSEELWEEVNRIIEEQERNRKQPLNRKTHLFTGFLHCHNGHPMYLRSRMKKYSCIECKLRIDKDDLEAVFQSRLKQFVFSEEEIDGFIAEANNHRETKKQEIEIAKGKMKDIENKMDKLLDLYLKGEIPTQGIQPTLQSTQRTTGTITSYLTRS